jgi:phosphoenolpyruvate carboxykinase (GTP)
METISKNTIFTNVALTPDGDVWWEGIGKEAPQTLKSWTRRDWYPGCGEEASHPNSRFTTPASQCPVIDPNWESPSGVPISGIIFGGRRSSTVPLVYEAFDWHHGTFVGSVVNSETTAAAAGQRGVLRPDPFAMKPFCGYHIGDYFAHWLRIGERAQSEQLPKIFHVNWFRKSAGGQFLWPGFGENARVLKWMFERTEPGVDKTGVVETPIGYIPAKGRLELEGLKNIGDPEMDELFRVEPNEWLNEVGKYREFYNSIGKKVPETLLKQLDQLASRLNAKKA